MEMLKKNTFARTGAGQVMDIVQAYTWEHLNGQPIWLLDEAQHSLGVVEEVRLNLTRQPFWAKVRTSLYEEVTIV